MVLILAQPGEREVQTGDMIVKYGTTVQVT